MQLYDDVNVKSLAGVVRTSTNLAQTLFHVLSLRSICSRCNEKRISRGDEIRLDTPVQRSRSRHGLNVPNHLPICATPVEPTEESISRRFDIALSLSCSLCSRSVEHRISNVNAWGITTHWEWVTRTWPPGPELRAKLSSTRFRGMFTFLNASNHPRASATSVLSTSLERAGGMGSDNTGGLA